METLINTIETQTVKTIVTREQISDKYAYFEKNVTTLNDKGKVIMTSTSHKFDLLKNVNTKNKGIRVEWMYGHYGAIYSVKKETLDSYLHGKMHIMDFIEDLKDELAPDNTYTYCIFNDGSHKIADLDGKVLPSPVFFNYIDGRISDAHYDIEKLLAYMEGKPDRFVILPPAKYQEKEAGSFIERIPYYNADSDTGKYDINFYYLPTYEEADATKEMDRWNRYAYLIEHSGIKDFEIPNKYKDEDFDDFD